VLYKIREVTAILRLSGSVIYEQIRAGRLRIVKQGRATLVPASAIAEYVALLEQEAHEQ
jgi:excisionase family DNA binding protein